MRILVVEDEPRMGELIRRVLVAEHHAVDLAPDGVSALAHAAGGEPYDVLVLDRMLPDLEGLELLRLLRARGVATPALMLTALGGVDERVAGLDAGADDYLGKPFAFSELLARVRALGRRPAASVPGPLVAGDLELDQERHVARVGGRSVDLSAREFALVYSNVVDLYVSYVRRKLAELGRERLLRTVRGVGYALRVDPA